MIPAFVNKAFARRAADACRRRQPVAAVRVRRGPRRRSRARARRRRVQPRLQPRQRRERHDQADRRDRPGADRRRRDRLHAGAARATSAARSSAARGPSASSGGPRRRRSPRACAGTWTGAASRPSTTAERGGGRRDPGRRARRRVASRHVLIISADIGEGHDLPARAVAREFKDEDPDAQVTIVNGLPAMGPVLTHLLRENSAFMFRWVPWWFDLQYRLFMNFAPTQVAGPAPAHRVRAPRPDAADPRPRSRPDRLDVPGCHGGAGRASPERTPGRARAIPRSPISPGCISGRIRGSTCTSSRTPSRPRRSRRSPDRAAFAGPSRRRRPRSWPRVRAATPDVRWACRRTGKVIAVSGGGWGVGDLVGATRAALAVDGATVLCLCGRNDKLRARVTQALRRRAAPAGDGFHRPDGRRARRQRRAHPFERRPDRARGDHPRLPGDLLRLRLRPRAGLQRRPEAVRAGPGRAHARARSARRSSARSSDAPSPTVRSRGGPRRPR